MAGIKIQSLTKEFNTNRGKERAVDNIGFEISEGEFISLVGPSGCGKTTTLRCIAGLEEPTSGKILFDGRDVTDTPANKRNTSLMFQDIALYPHMKIKDNIAYPLKVRGVSKDERYQESERAANLMQIDGLLDDYPGELSGGQQQRAALARTIVQEPVAFLMDEPLSDLDAKLKVDIRKEVQRIHQRIDQPTIYVTHDQKEALTMSDRIAIMNDGRIEQLASRKEVYHYPNNMFVAKFIGSPSMNFFDASINKLSRDSARVKIHDEEFSFEVSQLIREPSGSKVVIGIRPENIVPVTKSKNGTITGTVQLIEPVDNRAILTIQTENGEISSKISSDNTLSQDQKIELTLDPAGFYIFDPKTEELIARSKHSRSR